MKKKIITVKVKESIPIEINTPFIRLDAFLKLANVVQSGGHAKMVIQDGLVKVNGETTSSRGKKLHKGDKIYFEKEIYEVV